MKKIFILLAFLFISCSTKECIYQDRIDAIDKLIRKFEYRIYLNENDNSKTIIYKRFIRGLIQNRQMLEDRCNGKN